MGWSGYTIYSGDETQTCHYDFIKQAGIEKDENVICEWLRFRKTIIPKKQRHLLRKNVGQIIAKMPKTQYFRDEYDAITWQMLLALFLDNEIRPPKMVRNKGIEATLYLMGDHAAEFNEPYRRRKSLKNFLKRAGVKNV